VANGSTAPLYFKDPASSRFVGGGLAEAETLFGLPLPLLPPTELEDGRPVLLVRFHPGLRKLLQRFLQGLLSEISKETPLPGGPKQEDSQRNQAEYEAALARLLPSIRGSDRRQGLTNLFWLAHTRDIAECLYELETKNPAVKKLKYFLHPLLSSFYRRVVQNARRDLVRSDPGLVGLAGGSDNPGLVDALLEDGFAFTERTIGEFDFNQFLAANKRYRISADLFFEIYSILVKETERRIKEGDRGILNRVSRHMPQLPKEQLQSPTGIAKVMMNAQVMTYLFADAWGTGARLTASAKLKAESERRKPTEVLDAFLDLLNGVKRFELISHLRDRTVLLRPFDEDREADLRYSKNLRVYEFGASAQVLNNAVNASVLFLDLRGFTKTSEGQVSERDLTRELYVVFDAFVPHVRRFGGTIDKFLGDGMMITYGTLHSTPLDALNAVRTAILCQRTIRKMRDDGQTYFQMGISIHHGRVYLARFLADEEAVQSTVIGRNVNLAGRLSSAAKKPMDEDEVDPFEPVLPQSPTGLRVSVDKGGTLNNQGIAISRDTLTQIENTVALSHVEQENGRSRMEYFDEAIGMKLLIQYAGDAKFKGVNASFPVYEVDYES
jgi:class 3 adenylate cyclase